MTLVTSVPARPGRTIHDVARWIDRSLSTRWQATLAVHRARLEQRFEPHATRAYDTFLRLLCSPVTRLLRADGLQLYPQLPGGAVGSRANLRDGAYHRQRWLASALCDHHDRPLGMLVITVCEGLPRFEIERRPMAFALDVLGIDAVRASLWASTRELPCHMPCHEVQDRARSVV
jgi:Family of unknown function (DUF6022)